MDPARSLRDDYDALRQRLRRAVEGGREAGEDLFQLRMLDPPNREDLAGRVTSLPFPEELELGLAWVPEATPLSVHLFCNGHPIPGASGIFAGGAALFPLIPVMLCRRGGENELTVSLRFLGERWKYQLWANVRGRRALLDRGAQSEVGREPERLVRSMPLTAGW